MFASGSPWDLFHPSSPACLARRIEKGEPIYRDEIRIVMDENPNYVWTPPLSDLIASVEDGSFRGKSGPRNSICWALWPCYSVLVDFEMEDIKRRRAASGGKRLKTDRSVSEEAYETVARHQKLPFTGRALANQLSAMKLRGKPAKPVRQI